MRNLIGILACGVIVAGCGGHSGLGTTPGGPSGTGGGGGSTGLSGNSVASLATVFSVNVATGMVTLVTPTGSLSGPTQKKPGLFTGNSLGFTSSVLSNDALGNTGVRFLQVSIKNNTDLPVGAEPNGSPTGLQVIFGNFINTTGIISQESSTNVSAYAGTSAGFADGASAGAHFNQESGVAIGSDGSVYVADYGNNRIRKISQGYVSTLAGKGAAGEADGTATTAEFNGPYGIAVNPVDGSLIVADYLGDKIRRVTLTGMVNTVAGTGTAGSANGAGNAATFTNPTDVTVDASGNIYVSEAGSNRIRKITLTGSPAGSSANYTVAPFAGSGTAGLLDGTGTSAELNRPYGLATDPSGDVYAADYGNNVIRRIDPNANVTTIAGTGTQSDEDGYGNAAEFNRPIGVAYLNGAVFVTEASGEMVREVVPVPGAGVTSSGWAVMSLAGESTVSGDNNGAGAQATFNNMRYIAASQASSLYIADLGNNQVRRLTPSTGSFPIGTPLTGSSSTDQVTLSNPTGIVDDSDLGQAPYILYPLNGTLNPGQSTPAQAWNLVIPSGVESFQFQVLVQTSVAGLIPLQSASGAGSPSVDVSLFSGNNYAGGFRDGNANQARYGGTVIYMTVDGSGVLYCTDVSNNAIRRIAQDGSVSTIAGVPGIGAGSANGAGTSAQFSFPEGIAVNAAGTEIFVADSSNFLIREMELTGGDPTNAASWTVSTIAGKAGTEGAANGAGTVATFEEPFGLSLAPNGILYVADGLVTIRQIAYTGGARNEAADWQVSAFAGNGTSGYVNGPGASAEFRSVFGICSDPYGNLYAVDYSNQVIRKIDTSGNVTTFAGPAAPTPIAGYTDGPGSSALFAGPADICADSAGYLYVVDEGNDLIRRVSPAGIVTTVAGVPGNPGPEEGSGLTAEFSPNNVAISPSGDLFVSTGDSIQKIQTVFNSAAGKAKPK